MKKPAIPKSFAAPSFATQKKERGVTMVLVAVAMMAIIGMAALSIDIVTLYLDKEEAQRSADAAALAAARVIAVSGITGDPNNTTGNWGQICGPGGLATQAAQALVGQNTVASSAPGPTVSYLAGSGGSINPPTSDCQTLVGTAFGVNPLVTVKVTRTGLPTFFSRIWGNTANSVSATATAEAYNPSNSVNVGNQTSGSVTPVQPMCVKPWAVPNQNPLIPAPSGPGSCTPTGSSGACHTFVNADGSITDKGISLLGTGANGVIGENFYLGADCRMNGGNCTFHRKGGIPIQPQANFSGGGGGNVPPLPNLLYVPGQVDGNPTAVPSCSGTGPFEVAVTGCDQPTNYQCGVQNANWVDLSNNPNSVMTNAVQCLINQGNNGNGNLPTQDYLASATPGSGLPTAYPFQILAGTSNPMTSAGLAAGTPITSSTSIVALPIYDSSTQNINAAGKTQVTFVGFLEVFINSVSSQGYLNVTVLNIAGCGNGSGTVGTPIPGNSPVPVRLITPP